MLRNYLKIAFRNLARQKGYAFINIAGLAVGLAVCLVILSFVRHELSFDRFHEKADRIYRVAMEAPGAGGEVSRRARVAAPTGPAIAGAFPEVEHMARLMGINDEVLLQVETERFYIKGFVRTDPALFEIFDFPVLQGNPADLAEPYTLFLSETAARRLFGDADPLGQVIRYENRQDYTIRGVFQDIPYNSHVRFDLASSYESYFASGLSRDNWNLGLSHTYLLLREGQDAEALEAKLPAFMKTAHPYYNEAFKWTLTPLSNIHLYAGHEGEMIPQSDIRYVYLFSGIALLILLIACINYMNLATAHAARRGREVGIRKVVGANRLQLVRQFMGESMLFSALALVLALVLVELLLPWFNRIMDTQVTIRLLDEPGQMLLLVGGVAVVGLLAGSYPALYLSSFKPIAVLKDRMPMLSGRVLRKALVVFQFGVSMALIVCTAVMLRQMQHVRQERPGFSEEQVVVIPTYGELSNYAAFREALLQSAGVDMVTTSSFIAGETGYISFFPASDVEGLEGDTTNMVLYGFEVGYDFFETHGLEVVEGRAFAPSYTTDDPEAILVNETAVREFGWEEPIGKTIQEILGEGPRTVVGVVKDFHFTSLREEIAPTVFTLSPDRALTFVAAKVQPGDLPQTLSSIQATWDRFVPGRPFDYAFLDEGFDAMYRADERLMHLLASFSVLAILVACLGLFGLAAYTAVQRTKEIGIRKVLGATISNLVVLLSKDFVRLVLIAFVVATPVAWFAMRKWLEDFAYRIEIGPGIFLLAGALALVIALATVSYQAIKAALADPVKSLRYE
jgi:putative ABC transport system permease protein